MTLFHFDAVWNPLYLHAHPHAVARPLLGASTSTPACLPTPTHHPPLLFHTTLLPPPQVLQFVFGMDSDPAARADWAGSPESAAFTEVTSLVKFVAEQSQQQEAAARGAANA